jgi:hypothetical protein
MNDVVRPGERKSNPPALWMTRESYGKSPQTWMLAPVPPSDNGNGAEGSPGGRFTIAAAPVAREDEAACGGGCWD